MIIFSILPLKMKIHLDIEVYGAENRGRTDTMLPSRDFKSLASAYSAIPALILILKFNIYATWVQYIWSITPSLRAFPYCSNLRQFSIKFHIVRKRGSRHSHRKVSSSYYATALCAPGSGQRTAQSLVLFVKFGAHRLAALRLVFRLRISTFRV